MNPLLQLESLGQSIWLDYIRRDLMTSGQLARLIAEDGLGGMTSNPAIFEKAFASEDYAEAMTSAARSGGDTGAIYEALAIQDIRDAADLLKGVFDKTGGADGYVSLEVSPQLAHDTAGTLTEARRLWKAVGRANLMIKVPGTPEGAPAIRQLIAEGINVNVTLLFAREAYEAVAEAYLAGLEERVNAHQPIDRLASVASFFVSRIDSAVDALLDKRIAERPADRERLQALHGKTAIANAKLAYQTYEQLVASERWKKLAAKGARPQRLLWASTSTKNPDYRDVMYVEALIGRDTVNTLPPATLEAFRDHGVAAQTITQDIDEAREVLRSIEREGIRLESVTSQLLKEGVAQFADAFGKLGRAIEARVRTLPA